MEEKNLFPKQALPAWFSNCIQNYCKINASDFAGLATNMLNAAGYALSCNYELFVKQGWIERPNLWTIQIARSGAGKSHQFDDAIRSINQKDKQLYAQFKTKQKVYLDLLQLVKATKKDNDKDSILRKFLMDNGLGHLVESFEKNGESAIKPKLLNCSIENFTFEGLYKTISNNEFKPLLIKYDEIRGLFNNFNKFSKSDDEEAFLKLFNYAPLKKTRQDDELNIYIEEKTISVIGTTQKAALFDIFKLNRIQNGNVYRFLFVISNNGDEGTNVFDNLNTDVINNDALSEFYEFCNFYLNNYEHDSKRHSLKLDDETYTFLREWREEMNQKYRTVYDDEAYDSAMGKMDSYIHRIAIIINRLRLFGEYREKGDSNVLSYNTIYIDDYRNAALLVNFYLSNVMSVLDTVSVKSNQHFKNEEEELFYQDLPLTFSWSEFVLSHSKILKVSRKTSERRLRQWIEKGLIRKPNGKNEYQKTI